jgi:hypothetical protein
MKESAKKETEKVNKENVPTKNKENETKKWLKGSL